MGKFSLKIFWVISFIVGFSVYVANPIQASQNNNTFQENGFYYKTWYYDNTTVCIYNPDAPGFTYLDEKTDYQFPLVDGVLTIPSYVTHDGIEYPVSCVDGLIGQTDVHKIVIENGVRVVEGLSYCPFLEEIDLGSVNVVDHLNCYSLPSLKKLDLSRIERLYNFELGEHVEDLSMPVRYECQYWEENIGYWAVALRRLVLPEQRIQWGHNFIDSFTKSSLLEEVYCRSEIPMDFIHVIDMGDRPVLGIRPLEEPDNDNDNDNDNEIFVEEDGYTWQYNNVGGNEVDYENCKIFVPQGCVEAYREHPSWRKFANILEYDFSANKFVANDLHEVNFNIVGASVIATDGSEVSVYNISGQKVPNNSLMPGIYVAVTNGKVVKIAIH